MGPMIRGRRLNRRKVARWSTAAIAGLMVWSLVAAPSSIGQPEEVVEPLDLSAYHTQADAAPIRSTLTHNARLVELAPAIARSTSQISLPSQASATSWLAELGIANGLHGTTTGTRVLTEATASDPGGKKEEEFKVTNLTLGNDEHLTARTGRSYASADHADRPRSYGNSFVGNVCFGRRPGSPPDAPGTYDPDATFPGGPGLSPVPDPALQGLLCLVSFSSASSTSESVREQSNIKSVAVGEVTDLNLGLRTADGRCAGAVSCVRFDFIRAETVTEANAQSGGARAQWRVTLGRACRRTFDPTDPSPPIHPSLPSHNPTGQQEEDLCIGRAQLGFDQEGSGGGQSLRKISQLEQLNEQLEEHQIWQNVPGFEDTVVNITMHAGTTDSGVNDSEPDGRCEPDERNWAYPDPRDNPATPGADQTNPDRDAGQVACATAEGLSLEISIMNFGPSDEKLAENPLYQGIDDDPDTPGAQVNPPLPSQVPRCIPEEIAGRLPNSISTSVTTFDIPKCPAGTQTVSTDSVRAVRKLRLKLATASSSAIARPGFGVAPTDGEATPTIPEINIPEVNIPEINIPAFPAGGGQTVQQIINQGIQEGKWKVKLDWSSFKIKPWAAGDMFKGIFTGGMLGLAGWLGRRRLGLG